MSKLEQLIAQNKQASANAPKPTANKRGDKVQPIGNIHLKIAGVSVFTRSVWADSTSDTVFLNEINDMAVNDPEKLALITKELLKQATIEVQTKQTSDASLADLLG